MYRPNTFVLKTMQKDQQNLTSLFSFICDTGRHFCSNNTKYFQMWIFPKKDMRSSHIFITSIKWIKRNANFNFQVHDKLVSSKLLYTRIHNVYKQIWKVIIFLYFLIVRMNRVVRSSNSNCNCKTVKNAFKKFSLLLQTYSTN